MIAVTISHGNNASTERADTVVSIAQENPIRIFNKACPDIMLANNRMLRLNTRATYETASIRIRKGAISSGAPDGKNKSANCHLLEIAAV